MNLLSNALRYTRPGGIVLIACRKRGNQWRVEVRDNGIGISRADQSNIFREFFQLAQPQLDTQKGTGLGLAIVDRLVKLLGHNIELRSAPGKGSLFALELASAPEPAAVSGQVAESLPLAGKKLLIVDDDALVLDSTATILALWGYEVSAAPSLEAVQGQLNEGIVWDLVISDYRLGNDATGLDIIATVRQHLGKLTPCILISGDTSPAVLELAEAAGYLLLHKPVKPAKLRSLVQYLLKNPTHEITQNPACHS